MIDRYGEKYLVVLDLHCGVMFSNNIVIQLPLSVAYWCLIATFVPWVLPVIGERVI